MEVRGEVGNSIIRKADSALGTAKRALNEAAKEIRWLDENLTKRIAAHSGRFTIASKFGWVTLSKMRTLGIEEDDAAASEVADYLKPEDARELALALLAAAMEAEDR